ncbi:MAG: serine/threonine-protein kinase, partial [Gammaproteobacteria bacterium]
MSSDTGDSQEAMPDSEATVIRSTTGGAVSGSKDIRLEFIEKIRNHHFSFQKYQVQDKIGQGGMGSIHKGFDKNLHRTSVLKIILPNIQDDPSLFKQFIREAQITARLEHPNIIPVHDIGVIDGDKLHFAMKEVHGETLADILAEVKKAAPEKPRRFSFFALLTIFRKVCDAVAFAHSKGILHRDIKPDNIMVGNFGEVLLMDWGLAKLFDAEELQLPSDLDESLVPTLSPETTLSGVVKGSPAFMSPEQAKGQSELLDERSDVFLLGATLYNIATLSSPYTSANIEQTLNNAQQGTLSNPDLLASINTIPPDLTRIIEKTMALEPKQRYQKVDELIADIDAVLEGNTSATTKVFQAGEIIIKEGDVGEEAFLISSGRVKVFKTTDSGEVELFTLNHGDVIGEMALITKSVRSASIRALEQTELVMITREVMEQGLSQLPFWLKTTVNCLTERLAHANANVHPLFNIDCLYHVMRQRQI